MYAVLQTQHMSNEDFFNTHAAAGLVGLIGGAGAIDKAIRTIQRGIFKTPDGGLWSHAFIFSEKRADDFWWVLESDLDYGIKTMRLGVQENRVQKYYDEKLFPNVAILDFGLTMPQTKQLLSKGLNLLADGTRYSIREVLGTFISVKHTKLRKRENILAQDKSFYCSAFVQHCYDTVPIRFQDAVSTKNITPYDIANTSYNHKLYNLIRQ
jgi:hypothetical protein